MGWICDGIPKNGLEHPKGGKFHEPYENPDQAEECLKCELPKIAVVVSEDPISLPPPPQNSSFFGTRVVAIVLGIPLILGVATFSLPWILNLFNRETGSRDPSLECKRDEMQFSSGERNIFENITIYDGSAGLKSFTEKKYLEAESLFEREIKNNPSRPELVIYRNNSQARSAPGEPIKIAAVVPLEKEEDFGLEILRGIADAQTNFNQKQIQNEGKKLLEVVLYNQDDRSEQAQCIAKAIVEDQSILAVIGHNSSTLSTAALPTYTKAKVAMIDPVSGSTQLQARNFFRTIPSDSATAEKLVDYIFNDLKKKAESIAILYDSRDVDSDRLHNLLSQLLNPTETKVKTTTIDLHSENFDSTDVVNTLIKKDIGVAVLLPGQNTRSQTSAVVKASQKRLILVGDETLYDPKRLKQETNWGGIVLAVPWFPHISQDYGVSAETRWQSPITWRTASSYDATQGLLDVLQASVERDSILDRLTQLRLSETETAGLPLAFESGERVADPLLVEFCENPSTKDLNFVLVGECKEIPQPTPSPTPSAISTPTPRYTPIPQSTPTPQYTPTPRYDPPPQYNPTPRYNPPPPADPTPLPEPLF